MDSINDLMYKYYSSVVGGVNNLLGSLNVTHSAEGAEATTSVTANGTQTSPGAGVAVATTSNLSSGTWQIEVRTFITGTTVANLESDNMKFQIGATPIATIINPVSGTTGSTNVGILRIRLNIPGTAPVSVNAGAAATTGAVYKASIICSKIGS